MKTISSSYVSEWSDYVPNQKKIHFHSSKQPLTADTIHAPFHKIFDFCENIGVRAFHRCIYVIVVRKSIFSVKKLNY